MKTYKCKFKIKDPACQLIAQGEVVRRERNSALAVYGLMSELIHLGAYRAGEMIFIEAEVQPADEEEPSTKLSGELTPVSADSLQESIKDCRAEVSEWAKKRMNFGKLWRN